LNSKGFKGERREDGFLHGFSVLLDNKEEELTWKEDFEHSSRQKINVNFLTI